MSFLKKLEKNNLTQIADYLVKPDVQVGHTRQLLKLTARHVPATYPQMS